MVIPSHLRIGNWIHRKGSSRYGTVTGDILAQMEREEKFREKFEGIELTGELLAAAGFEFNNGDAQRWGGIAIDLKRSTDFPGKFIVLNIIRSGRTLKKCTYVQFIHELQNLYFCLNGSELPLPESARIVPEKINS